MKIADIRATTVTVPLQAPLRHSNGAHWGRFVRTIVEVEADNGLIGIGELGGGGESAEMSVRGMKAYLVGHDPLDLNSLQFKIMNPTGSLYNNRMQIHAAIEFACLDLAGKFLNVPVYQLLGGKFREKVDFASYLFFRYPDSEGHGEVRTPEQLVAHTRELKERYGFRTHKLKGGVFPPRYELDCYRALADSFTNDHFRFDPNAALSLEDAIRFGNAIEDINNDYYEDPTWGLNGLRRLKSFVRIPLATNTVVINFEQLVTNLRDVAVDVVLLDTTFWGGIRSCVKAAQICDAFQLGVSVHSSGELGIQLATMLHLGVVLPNLTFAADAHYHHLRDDIIQGGKFDYVDGAIAVPDGPGLGVTLDYDKVAEYAELYRALGNYPYDRDPGRPKWYAMVPNRDWADPNAQGSGVLKGVVPFEG